MRPFFGYYFLALFALCPSVSSGQAFGFAVDANVPTYSDLGTAGGVDYNLETGFSFTAGFHSGDFGQANVGSRWSIIVGHQSATASLISGERYPSSYSALALKFGFEHRVFRGPRVSGGAGVAIGPTFISKESQSFFDYCDSIFCGTPNTTWQFSPKINLYIPFAKKVSVVLGLRYAMFTNQGGVTYPFDSGTVASVGVEFSWK